MLQDKQRESIVETFVDLTTAELIDIALQRKEGILSSNQALRVTTGDRTGRSPKDRFIVKEENTAADIDWGVINQPIDEDIFHTLWEQAVSYIQDRETFVSNQQVGADPQYYIPVKVITELAWHNLFTQNLFIRPKGSHNPDNKPEWTILNVPSLKTDSARDGVNSDATLIIHLSERKVLLRGLLYAGEMKKAMFSVMNFLLPEHDILPMHCAANQDDNNDVSLFFGLSGTGKTTLSADQERLLIGDDEHGWGEDGVFNFEGGCYAKCIDLSKEREPVIWDAIKYGAIMENVVLDEDSKIPDYKDDHFTQNTRAAYPREHIPDRVEDNRSGQPNSVIFLCCDMYGVLPPVAKLNKEQAAYYFLSGYTALIGSTEVGHSAAIKPTFSTCFGAPFFPRPASVYANLLIKRIKKSGASVYLVNTGWTGGPYGQGGERFDIPVTRTLIHAIQNGELEKVDTTIVPGFNFSIPNSLMNVDSQLLNPRNCWKDKQAFDVQQQVLIENFIENFKRFDVADNIRDAGPEVIA